MNYPNHPLKRNVIMIICRRALRSPGNNKYIAVCVEKANNKAKVGVVFST